MRSIWNFAVILLLFGSRVYGTDSVFACFPLADTVASPTTHLCTGFCPLNPTLGNVRAVVIYASGPGRSSDNLPSWKDSIWNINIQRSVPKYYKDNSLNRYILSATTFGRDSFHCFVSDSLFTANCVPQLTGGGRAYLLDVLRKADSIINFADFDNDGPNGIPASQDTTNGGQGDDDGIVDAMAIVTVNHPRTSGTLLNCDAKDTVHTGDFSVGGRRIVICGCRTTVQFAENRTKALRIICHEWGHLLGATDLPQFGGFSLMNNSFGFFQDHPPPLDPFWRKYFGWVDTIEVTVPQYSQSFADYLTTGTVYKLTASGQSFFVTGRKQIDPNDNLAADWESFFPDSGGLLIWQLGSGYLDFEPAHGMFRYNDTTCAIIASDSSSWGAIDSLEIDRWTCGTGIGTASAYWPYYPSWPAR
ncbi:MAG: hypothetical protein L0Z48_09225 [candidate division Zixibacteria bacterium]|nr:hypothetical protein [candidate division Zixibacteria bacterium]